MLIFAYYLLKRQCKYHDLSSDYFNLRNKVARLTGWSRNWASCAITLRFSRLALKGLRDA